MEEGFLESELFISLIEMKQNMLRETVDNWIGEEFWISLPSCRVCEPGFYVDQYGLCVPESCREWDSLGHCIQCNYKEGFHLKTQESKCVFECEFPYEEVEEGR